MQSQKSVGVTATLDWIKIQADKLRLDPRTLRLEAIGNVMQPSSYGHLKDWLKERIE